MALDRGITRARTVFRVGYYLPVVTSIVAIAVVWRYVLNPDVGLVNMALGALGIHGPDWLGDPLGCGSPLPAGLSAECCRSAVGCGSAVRYSWAAGCSRAAAESR